MPPAMASLLISSFGGYYQICPRKHEGVAESAASSLWLCSLNYLVVKAFLLGQKADKFASNLQRAEAAEREGDSS